MRDDYGNPDHFRLWLDFADLTQTGLTGWRGQRLDNGLPIVTTTWERDGVRYQIEEFAYPLDGPPPERRGDLQMVLCERIRITELTGRPRTVPLTFYHERSVPHDDFRFDRQGADWMLSTENATWSSPTCASSKVLPPDRECSQSPSRTPNVS